MFVCVCERESRLMALCYQVQMAARAAVDECEGLWVQMVYKLKEENAANIQTLKTEMTSLKTEMTSLKTEMTSLKTAMKASSTTRILQCALRFVSVGSFAVIYDEKQDSNGRYMYTEGNSSDIVKRALSNFMKDSGLYIQDHYALSSQPQNANQPMSQEDKAKGQEKFNKAICVQIHGITGHLPTVKLTEGKPAIFW
jgi:hypothetical protein